MIFLIVVFISAVYSIPTSKRETDPEIYDSTSVIDPVSDEVEYHAEVDDHGGFLPFLGR